jgi:hypothetical protein
MMNNIPKAFNPDRNTVKADKNRESQISQSDFVKNKRDNVVQFSQKSNVV